MDRFKMIIVGVVLIALGVFSIKAGMTKIKDKSQTGVAGNMKKGGTAIGQVLMPALLVLLGLGLIYTALTGAR